MLSFLRIFFLRFNICFKFCCSYLIFWHTFDILFLNIWDYLWRFTVNMWLAQEHRKIPATLDFIGIYGDFSVVLHRRLELRTPWLKVKCSTVWANGAKIMLKYNITNILLCQQFFWKIMLSSAMSKAYLYILSEKNTWFVVQFVL